MSADQPGFSRFPVADGELIHWNRVNFAPIFLALCLWVCNRRYAVDRECAVTNRTYDCQLCFGAIESVLNRDMSGLLFDLTCLDPTIVGEIRLNRSFRDASLRQISQTRCHFTFAAFTTWQRWADRLFSLLRSSKTVAHPPADWCHLP